MHTVVILLCKGLLSHVNYESWLSRKKHTQLFGLSSLLVAKKYQALIKLQVPFFLVIQVFIGASLLSNEKAFSLNEML